MANELWRIAGGNHIDVYDSPEILWRKAEQYFEWCDTNPIKSKRTLQTGKTAGNKVEIEHTRPYSLKGFCLFSGLTEQWLKDMMASQDKTTIWYMVIEKIFYIIYNQNLEGALVDLFNPIMVSKLLGLDKPEEETRKTARVEIVDSTSNRLANSENEILQNLNNEKLNLVKTKSENLKRENEDDTHLNGSEDIKISGNIG